jgi:hypothetical protein
MAQKKAILLRIAPKLWEQLNQWARDELRSVNGQIEYLLREAVRRRAGGEAKRDDSDGDEADGDMA